jgi:hypothetical protein
VIGVWVSNCIDAVGGLLDELRDKGISKSAIGAGDEHASLHSKDSCYFECLQM